MEPQESLEAPRRPRRNESPRYMFRITNLQHDRLRKMGSVERRKFVKFVRGRFTLDLDEWEGPQTARVAALEIPPTVISDTGKYVTGKELLELLFSEKCRPNVRWLNEMKKRRRVPAYKVRGKVFYDPEEVREYWKKKGVIRAV